MKKTNHCRSLNYGRRPGLFILLAIVIMSFLNICVAHAATPAGYSEYYIPGDEDTMGLVLCREGLTACPDGYHMHTVISVTAWSDTTTVYYDHWEDGYNFDPADPSTADETYTLNTGQVHAFETANISLPTSTQATCSPAGTCPYDGRDHIYVAGGVVTVTRVGWVEERGVGLQGVAWEIYPVKPQLTNYVVPFGETSGWYGFQRLNTLIQATQDNTTVTVDLNHDGTPDMLDTDRDGNVDTSTILLQAGESFLLDDVSAHVAAGTMDEGAVINGSETLQVKYITGRIDINHCTRGFSAFPRGYWTKDYYAPLDQPLPDVNGQASDTDYYLYNPNSSPITINWEANSSVGSFSIPATSTVSFRTATGGSVSIDSGLYLKGSDFFWGVGSNDANHTGYNTSGYAHEWGYSLLPTTMLYTEHFLGWAPDGLPLAVGRTQMGVFLTPAQDNTHIFVDFNNDGTSDQTYPLNRLQTQYVSDPDGDMSGARIWATGPFSMAYGQNSHNSDNSSPALDLGYIAIPGSDFISLVLSVHETVNPQAVLTPSGSQAVFTITVNSKKYTVDGVNVTDYLPTGWMYVNDSTTITRPDQTQLTGAAANPGINGSALTWSGAQVGGNMFQNQEITITFTGQTTQNFTTGDISQSTVKAVGTRTVGNVTQTFTATDFVFNTYVDSTLSMQVSKTSSVPEAIPVNPGDTITYTVTATNPASSTVPLTGISIYDALPAGVSYVDSSSQVTGTRTVTQTDNVRDNFGTQAYNHNDGSVNWASSWIESDATQDPNSDNIRITGEELRIGRTSNIYRQVDLSSATSATLTLDYRTSGNIDWGEYAYIEVASSPTGPWTIAHSFQNDQSGSVNESIPNSLWSATTILRIRTSGYDNNEYLYIDNVDITYIHTNSSSGTSAAGDPPVFISSSDGYYLAPGQQMTLTYSVTVDSPLATGIDQITNTAAINCNEIVLPLSASVTNIVVNPSSQSASAGDRVWFDINGSGLLDVGEPGLPNVEVTLKDQYGTPLMTSTTDATGHYLFNGINPGNGYYVEVTSGTLPVGLEQSAPLGHSDNRTNTFDLTNGQFYTDADLGYKSAAGYAAVGNIVWSDADSSGTRNPGEPGIAGVTVQLYQDTNDNGAFDSGTDALWGTVTTAADGTYLITGVPAGGTEDYFVYIDESQAKLTGYTRTAPSNDPLYINNLTAGDVIQYANFGYHGTTYAITDRIWFDADGDGSLDAGETGIGLVTVDLLDASLYAIATTTTGADGNFTFSGVIGGGADYTVRITDTNSKLTDYFGTTSSAITRSLQIPNLTGNIDYSATPNFGYGLTNSVAGSVFNDLSNNGGMESGEPGISGVIVKLYNDANGNGQIDAGSDTVRATLTTDPYGNYIFSGLSNGNYVVSVELPPSGYTYTGTDSDPVTTGQQQAANIAANGNALNKNFGYYSSAARSVSGSLWNDTNNNGVNDTGETGIAGVTISLLQGSNVIAATSTASDGSYSFIGLTASAYTVRITDDAGVLSGYIGTYEKTEGITGPFNGEEDVNLSSDSLTGIDFGYVSPAIPTLVVLSSFSVHGQDGEVVVQWETASEHNTLGFYLLRLDTATGEYRSVTQGLLPGLLNAPPRGGRYTLIDSGASPGSVYRYKLVEVERNGRRITYGPFTVSATTENETAVNVVRNSSAKLTVEANSAGQSSYTRQARQQSLLQKAFAEERLALVSTLTTMKSKSAQATGSRLKIPVREDGLYYVDAEDIAAATGIRYAKAKKLIGRNSLAVSNQGQAVAYLPAVNNAGIYFYGTGINSSYTRDNIYWIDKAKGITMQEDDKTLLPLSINPGAAFTDTLHLEQNLVQNMFQTSDPSEDFWDWDLIYLSSSYSDAPKTFSFSLNGKSDTQAEATLQVHLVGGSDSGIEQDHHVVVSLNGRQIVEGWWGGLNEYVVTATFDQSILNERDNTIEVKGILDEGIPWSMFYINSFDLTYERLYKAAGNKLFFTGDGNQIVTIGGFTTATPDIFLFNITDPRRPKFNTSASIDGSAGNYELSFNVASQSARYLAVSGDAAVKVVNAAGINPSRLKANRNAADYLIIAPGELVSAAEPLAAYRKVQKMKTMVVNLDDIMNEFNFGISSPEAIREFLTYAYHNWRKTPKYVVLVGTGTWDYRDNLGAGGNLIPPALVPTSYGLSTSDNHLADIDGDHIPDMAIGRLPVGNSQELQDVIGKIKTFERTAGNKVILLADRPDEGGNFSSDSEAIAGFFPPGYTLEKVYLGEYASTDTAKQVLLNYINSGAVFFNFIGHAAPDMLSAEGVLTTDDMDSLINGSGLPIITAMTCTAGEFAIPGYPSMSQLMVLKSNGGAAAFWSSTGLSDNSESAILNREFYNAVCTGQKLTLGDAVLEAFKKYGTTGSMPFMTDIYTILGDPALRLK